MVFYIAPIFRPGLGGQNGHGLSSGYEKTEPGFQAAEITFLFPGLGGGVCRANGARPPLTKLRTS